MSNPSKLLFVSKLPFLVQFEGYANGRPFSEDISDLTAVEDYTPPEHRQNHGPGSTLVLKVKEGGRESTRRINVRGDSETVSTEIMRARADFEAAVQVAVEKRTFSNQTCANPAVEISETDEELAARERRHAAPAERPSHARRQRPSHVRAQRGRPHRQQQQPRADMSA